MELVDILILVILGIFLLKGVLRGLLREVCTLLGLVLGGLLAFYLHVPLSQWFMGMFHWPSQLCVTISFLLVFLLTVVVFGALGYLLNRFAKLTFMTGVNRILGAIFGMAQGVVLLSLILFALNAADLPGNFNQQLKKSELAPPFSRLGETIFSSSKDLALS
ncbi:MAG: CvpA family protein [Geopsychrobacter sp.]|nr:CvpA family protein [Geopsychrobacter sp.]